MRYITGIEPRERPERSEYDDPPACPACGGEMDGDYCVECDYEYDDPRMTDHTLPGNV